MLDKRNFYINGKWVPPSMPNDLEVINPSNEEAFAVISLGGSADTNAAVQAARRAFLAWSKTNKDERIVLLEKLYEIYKSRWNEMSEIISTEMGAPIEMASEQLAMRLLCSEARVDSNLVRRGNLPKSQYRGISLRKNISFFLIRVCFDG